MMKKAARRGKEQSGFTLSEVLVSILIMLLASSLIVSTMNLALNQYGKQTSETEAQLMCAALATSVQEELLYARNIRQSDGVVTFFDTCRNVGANARLFAQDGMIYISSGGESTPLPLVTGADIGVSGELTASLVLTWDGSLCLFNADISVVSAGGGSSSAKFSVQPIDPAGI